MVSDRALLPPRSVEDLKKLVVNRQVEFSTTLRTILETAFTRPELIAFGNKASLSSRCKLSQSSITRALSSLGFRSFSEFRQVFRLHMLERSQGPKTVKEGNCGNGYFANGGPLRH
jgi:DNA-binding MurR/RpiR family transcriptional regulator